MTSLKSLALGAALAAALALHTPAFAHRHGDSEASLALSALPVAVSVIAPAMVLSAGAAFSVVAVEVSVDGTVWILERAADGARATIRFAGKAAGGLSLAVGTAVTVTAIGAGWVLSAAGAAIAFIPNEVGKALLYNERVTR
jgi:hypothetical protein